MDKWQSAIALLFFKPRDLPGKWPRDFSAEELDIVGTVETYCEAVMFKRAMLIDVMMDRKFVSRSKSLEGDYQSNGKGRRDSKVEGCPKSSCRANSNSRLYHSS